MFKSIVGALVLGLFFHRLSAQEVSKASIQSVNMDKDEQNPVISPDGNLLVFTVANHPQNMGGLRDPFDRPRDLDRRHHRELRRQPLDGTAPDRHL